MATYQYKTHIVIVLSNITNTVSQLKLSISRVECGSVEVSHSDVCLNNLYTDELTSPMHPIRTCCRVKGSMTIHLAKIFLASDSISE